MNIIDEKNEVVGGEYLGCLVDCNFTFGKAFIQSDFEKIVLDDARVQYYEVISQKNGSNKMARNMTEVAFGLLGKTVLEHKVGRLSFCVKIYFLDGKTSIIACEETVYKAIKRYCRAKTEDTPFKRTSYHPKITEGEDSYQDDGYDDFDVI